MSAQTVSRREFARRLAIAVAFAAPTVFLGVVVARIVHEVGHWLAACVHGTSLPGIRVCLTGEGSPGLVRPMPGFRSSPCDATRNRTGSLPETLGALVPTEMPSVLEDPYRPGHPLVYSRKGKEFSLYSVGPNKGDDGGVSADSQRAIDSDGDMTLDGWFKKP